MSGFALVPAALRRAGREWRLALLLWAIEAALAMVVVAPLLPFLGERLAHNPVADRLLERFDLVLVSDLAETARPFFAALAPLVAFALASALLLNAFAAGGAIEALRPGDRRPLRVRFFAGGARHFGRFLRMGMASIPLAAVTAGIVSAPIWVVRGALGIPAEGARYFLGLAGAAAAAFGALLVLLALDLARLRLAESGERRGVRLLFRSVRRLLRRPGPALALWAGLALALVVAGAALAFLRGAIVPRSALLLLALVLLQQAAVAARAFYRVALWAGEARLVAAEGVRGSRIGP
jgi:hypothetical protein